MSLADVGTDVATALVADSGSSWTYTHVATPATLSFYKADLPPTIVDVGAGQLTEVIMADFRGLMTDFTTAFGASAKPARGDTISDGTNTYEVQPIVDKCFYTVGGLLHIHAKLKS